MVTADKPSVWSIGHAAYPVRGPLSAQLEYLVYAILAPSTHNSQPRTTGGLVFADSSGVIALDARVVIAATV